MLADGRSRALEARNTHANRKRAERNAAQAEAAARAIKEQQRKGGRVGAGAAAASGAGADSLEEGAASASTGASPASSTRSATIKQEAMDVSSSSPSQLDTSRTTRARHGTAIAFQQPAAPAPQSMNFLYSQHLQKRLWIFIILHNSTV